MIDLHESMGPGRDQTRDPWICTQTRICSQTCYRLVEKTYDRDGQATTHFLKRGHISHNSLLTANKMQLDLSPIFFKKHESNHSNLTSGFSHRGQSSVYSKPQSNKFIVYFSILSENGILLSWTVISPRQHHLMILPKINLERGHDPHHNC